MSVPRVNRWLRKHRRHASFLRTQRKIFLERPNGLAGSCVTVYDIVVRRSEMVSTERRSCW